MLPMDRGAGAQGATPTQSKPAPPPQAVRINRNLNEVVTAKRMGDQRVEMPKHLQAPEVQANAGAGLVFALIVGLILAAILIALVAR